MNSILVGFEKTLKKKMFIDDLNKIHIANLNCNWLFYMIVSRSLFEVSKSDNIIVVYNGF